MSVLEKFDNGFCFNFFVLLVKEIIHYLEMYLSLVMIVSFSTRVILLEIDPFALKWGFVDFKNFCYSHISKIYIAEMLPFCFSQKIHATVSLGFTFTPVFITSWLLKLLFNFDLFRISFLTPLFINELNVFLKENHFLPDSQFW